MAKLNGAISFSSSHFIGPLLNDGSLYSGLGLLDLRMLFLYLRNNWNSKLDPLPSAVADHTHWQYGSGSRKSDYQQMLGSNMIPMSMNDVQ